MDDSDVTLKRPHEAYTRPLKSIYVGNQNISSFTCFQNFKICSFKKKPSYKEMLRFSVQRCLNLAAISEPCIYLYKGAIDLARGAIAYSQNSPLTMTGNKSIVQHAAPSSSFQPEKSSSFYCTVPHPCILYTSIHINPPLSVAFNTNVLAFTPTKLYISIRP